MKNRMWTYLMGLLSGMMLLSGGYAAANTMLAANPSTQTFYVNGLRVQFEAYEIHGNNFVKLRDIGQAVDFGVEYEAATNSVRIDSNSRYQEEVTHHTVAKGIRAIRMLAEGFSNREIGERYQVPANHVTAWVSKARKYLAAMPT